MTAIDKKSDGGLKPTTNQYMLRINTDGSVIRLMEEKILTPNVSIRSIRNKPIITRKTLRPDKEKNLTSLSMSSSRTNINRRSSPNLLTVKNK